MAELMRYYTGTCGDACYVQIDSDVHLLKENDTLSHPREPCLQFRCEVSELIQKSTAGRDGYQSYVLQSSGPKHNYIQCPKKVTCKEGQQLVRYHGQCCQQCVGKICYFAYHFVRV